MANGRKKRGLFKNYCQDAKFPVLLSPEPARMTEFVLRGNVILRLRIWG